MTEKNTKKTTSKNDLSSFKNLENKNVLKNEISKTKKKIGGRKPKLKPEKEKEMVRIQFYITKSEAEILKKKEGRLSTSLFVKSFLREDTKLFD